MNELQKNAYKIDSSKVIGRGSSGIVFPCTCPQFPNQQLCIKRIAKIIKQNDFNTDFNQGVAKREVDILKSLQHIENHHITKIIDVYEDDQYINIVMEYCNEGDLYNLIQQRRQKNIKPTAQEALDFIYQFCEGYSVIYDMNILHRDIKPQNILIQKDQAQYIYKITDFGASRTLENMIEKNNYTKICTKSYASPQINSDQKFSSKTDVYSFGIVLYECIFQQLPYAQNQQEIIEYQNYRKNTPFKVNQLNLNGSQEELSEIQLILESTIVYEEDNLNRLEVTNDKNQIYQCLPLVLEINLTEFQYNQSARRVLIPYSKITYTTITINGYSDVSIKSIKSRTFIKQINDFRVSKNYKMPSTYTFLSKVVVDKKIISLEFN